MSVLGGVVPQSVIAVAAETHFDDDLLSLRQHAQCWREKSFVLRMCVKLRDYAGPFR